MRERDVDLRARFALQPFEFHRGHDSDHRDHYNQLRSLRVAGALIAAEIDRIVRGMDRKPVEEPKKEAGTE